MLTARLAGPPAQPPASPTVNGLLARAAASDRGVTFVDLREHEQTLSWAEVQSRAERAASQLRAMLPTRVRVRRDGAVSMKPTAKSAVASAEPTSKRLPSSHSRSPSRPTNGRGSSSELDIRTRRGGPAEIGAAAGTILRGWLMGAAGTTRAPHSPQNF